MAIKSLELHDKSRSLLQSFTGVTPQWTSMAPVCCSLPALLSIPLRGLDLILNLGFSRFCTRISKLTPKAQKLGIRNIALFAHEQLK